MDETEARRILSRQLEPYRRRSYRELVQLIGRPVTGEAVSGTGTSYQWEIQIFWDDREDGDVRLSGCIDDGGIRALLPLTESFVMAPDGRLVGD